MEDFVKQALEEYIIVNRYWQKPFEITSYKKSNSTETYYGVATSPDGMTSISWATDGHSVTYYGDVLVPNLSLLIKKDGGTRTAFNGYVFSKEEVLTLLKQTW